MAKKYSGLEIKMSVEDFAWETGMVLRGFSCNRRGSGWLLVVRADNKRGHPKVGFSEHSTPQKALEYLLDMSGGRYAKMFWQKDKYPRR